MRFRIIILRILLPLLFATVFTGCGTRAPRTPVAATATSISLEEQKARELITIWRDDLTDYLDEEEGDWPTRLSQLRDIQIRRGLRPGRICFATLAAGGDPDRAAAWDVNGLLLGQEVIGGRPWYLFIVGIVQREDFRPIEVRDIRLVAFATGDEDPLWRQGAANPQSLKWYKNVYWENLPIRFPADDDNFGVVVTRSQVTVRELHSGAEWTIALTAEP